MARETKKERFSVSLSPTTVGRLKEQAATEGGPLSAVLARIVDDYYNSSIDYTQEMEELEHKYREAEQRADTEVDAVKRELEREQARTAQIIDEQADRLKAQQNSLEHAKTEIENLRQELTDKEDTLKELVKEKRELKEGAEQQIAAKSEQIQKLEEGIPELLKRMEHERASKETVTTGLQHELELTQNNLKKAEGQIVDLKGQIQDLKEDKQNLQRQLELVTLRLPAPKEGFWFRVFGRRKKEQGA